MKIYFAPMEGITDGILRSVHHEIFGGIDVYGIPFHKLTHTFSLTTREQRDVDPAENAGISVLPQALTKDPEQLLRWLEYIKSMGYSVADLNIGCPSPTVTRRGRGSGMLIDLTPLRRFLDAVFGNLPMPLSVKTRIGYVEPEEWPALLSLLAAYPFEHISVHARTAEEQYTGGIHPEAFLLTSKYPQQHFIYNGDIRTVADAAEIPGHAYGIMIGRGLLANPSLAREIRGGAPASQDELSAWYHALYRGWTDRFGASISLGRLKKLMIWPCEELPDSQKMLRQIRKAKDIDDCIGAVLEQHYSQRAAN